MKSARLVPVVALLLGGLLATGCGDHAHTGTPPTTGRSSEPDPAGATTRPASSLVPTRAVSVRGSWRLAAGGTPATKLLTGSRAARLARAFNLLPVAVGDAKACTPSAVRAAPMLLQFTAGGHTWTVRMTRCAPYDVRTSSGEAITVDGSAAFRRTLRRQLGWMPGESAAGGVMTPLGRSAR